jgi:preprotein translocase subunit SecG
MLSILADVSWGQSVVATLFVLICILLILVILVQKGRGGGLSGAFGGVGGHSAFGAKTGDVFTWITICLTFLFVATAVVGNYAFHPTEAAPPPAMSSEGEPTDAAAPAAPSTQPQ